MGSLGEACTEAVCPSLRRCCRAGLSAGGSYHGRDTGSQLGAMRPQYVAQRVDRRVQSATAGAGVVPTPPAYAPPFAPADVPPPPPQPQGAPSVGWDPGHQEWGMWEGPVWIPQ